MAAMAPEEMDAWGEVPNLGEEVIQPGEMRRLQ